MLRRKLIFNLCPPVVLLLITAVAAVLLLQGVLRQLDHVNHEAWVVVDEVNQLSIAVNATEVDLYEIQLGKERYLDRMIESVENVRRLAGELSEHYVIGEKDAAPLYAQITNRLPDFIRHVGALATVQDEMLAHDHGQAALESAVALRQATLPLSRVVREHAQREQESLSGRFRWLVMGLGLVFLAVINVSVLMLLRLATMILRPVDTLVNATRELSQEHFGHRVKLDAHDEFDELAAAYNTLAEHLQSNEKRRIEVLGQSALALNHELNNAMATIELQLGLLNRRADDPQTERRLRTIQQSLSRMRDTVQSLKNVRRIVLTDYGQGMKMLDLVRSAARDEDHAEQEVTP
jgi:signal transduction histidine kinase